MIGTKLCDDMPSKFNMEKTAKPTNKRGLNEDSGSNKIPKAGDVVVDAVMPRAASQSTRPAHADIVVCMYKYTNRAGDLLPNYAEKEDVALYQIQIEHNCRNSVTYNFRKRFEAFLRASRENSSSVPGTVDALAEQAGVHVVIASGDNSKGGVAIPWRVALYVAGDESAVKNALLLVDAYFQREVAAGKEPVKVHLHPHLGMNDIKGVMEELR